jgi:uncharacterized FlaG/YvyC family protein
MDVGTVSSSTTALRLASATAGQAKVAAQPLHQEEAARGPKLEVMDQVIDAVESGRSLEMHYDKEISRVVVQVMDGKTGKVVFQIPSDELVNSMKSFRNYLKATGKGV